jgi:uncharacterized protein (TIGR02147 family)
MRQRKKEPNIYTFTNYREYLKKYIDFRKSSDKAYGFQNFADEAGQGSASHIRMVISGQRNLSEEMADVYAKTIGLNDKKTDFLKELIQFSQEETTENQINSLLKMLHLRSQIKHREIEDKEKAFLRNWYVPVIFVLVGTSDFEPSTSWIEKRLQNRVGKDAILKTLWLLLDLGFVKNESKKGVVQVPVSLKTKNDITDPDIQKFHKEVIELAENSLFHDAFVEKEFNTSQINIPAEKMDEFKARIREFQIEMNKMARELSGTEEVYQLNVQLFPETEE